jgi:hypothetical protein
VIDYRDEPVGPNFRRASAGHSIRTCHGCQRERMHLRHESLCRDCKDALERARVLVEQAQAAADTVPVRLPWINYASYFGQYTERHSHIADSLRDALHALAMALVSPDITPTAWDDPETRHPFQPYTEYSRNETKQHRMQRAVADALTAALHALKPVMKSCWDAGYQEGGSILKRAMAGDLDYTSFNKALERRTPDVEEKP